MERPPRRETSYTPSHSLTNRRDHTYYAIIYTTRRIIIGVHYGAYSCFTVSFVGWLADDLLSPSLNNVTDSDERPRLSSASAFFWRLKRLFVSADHCETPALPSTLTRMKNRHTIYPNTMLVEIHTDKAVRKRMRMLRNVPVRIDYGTWSRKRMCG